MSHPLVYRITPDSSAHEVVIVITRYPFTDGTPAVKLEIIDGGRCTHVVLVQDQASDLAAAIVALLAAPKELV